MAGHGVGVVFGAAHSVPFKFSDLALAQATL